MVFLGDIFIYRMLVALSYAAFSNYLLSLGKLNLRLVTISVFEN